MSTTRVTLVVPPMYEATIFGASAVKISTRKVYLCGPDLKPIASRTYKGTDKIPGMSFRELCAFVRFENPL